MENQLPFESFGKIARLSRECTITEKIDGSNALIEIGKDGSFHTGSRTRWITPDDDNMGFSKWAHEHKEELLRLGPGRHFGEWWGNKIQRQYGLIEKRFSLFNVHRWGKVCTPPQCCHIVPIIATGLFSTNLIEEAMDHLTANGSMAAPGFKKPEGIIVYHSAAEIFFKKTFEKDTEWKSKK